MYVCTKSYYKLPDKDIMLNYEYPFSRSRNRITTQQVTTNAHHWSKSRVN